MFRKLFITLTVLVVGYVAWPFWTVLELKRAVRNHDVATLERTIEWDSLRRSLRASLAEQIPDESKRRLARIPVVGRFFERAAHRYGPGTIDRMVESYGNPQGLIELAALRDQVKGKPPARTALAIAAELAERTKRVAFTSLTRLELAITARNDPTRLIHSVIELRDGGWKLTEVRFSRLDDLLPQD